MEEMQFRTVLAVFEEMFGPMLFWGLVAAAAVITLAYIYVLLRDRAVSWRKFIWAQVSMPFGAVAAVWFLFSVTDSGLSDVGGPIDVILLLGVAVAGAIGLAILVYTLESLIRPPSPYGSDP